MIITPKMMVFSQVVNPLYALTIENKPIVEVCRLMFEFMWESLPDNNL